MRVDDLINYLNKYKSKYSDIDIQRINFDGVDFSTDSETIRLQKQIEDLDCKIEDLEQENKELNRQNSKFEEKIDLFKRKLQELLNEG